MSMKRISCRETLLLPRHFTKSESLNFKTESCQSKFNLFFVMVVCLSSVFKNLSYLLKQSFSKLQVMTKSHSFLALGDCAVFFRTWLLCYVILLLTLVRRFSVLGARAVFPRTWRSTVFPVLGAHAVFFALGARAMFSHAWRSSFVSCTWRSVEFSCAWRPCCALTHLTSTLCTFCACYCVHHEM